MICSRCHNQMASTCEDCESKDRAAMQKWVARRCAEIVQAGIIRWPEAAEEIRAAIEREFGLHTPEQIASEEQ